jgi:hypothetical protein
MKKMLALIICHLLVAGTTYPQWNLEYLSLARAHLSSAQLGDEIYFIGGNESPGNTSVIDVYNTATSTWGQYLFLSSPKAITAAVAGDSALYVVGGIEYWSNPIVGTNTMDVFSNGVRTTQTLPDYMFGGCALHVGGKIMITGAAQSFDQNTGSYMYSNKVYIYDEQTETWSIDTLSTPRVGMAGATDGVIAIFAGGSRGLNQPSDVVDIYNSATNTWSTAFLSEARSYISAVYSDGKFYFAGGAKAGINNSSTVIDIYNGSAWTTDNLSFPRAGIRACAAGDKIFFTGGGNANMQTDYFTSSTSRVDIYDASLGTWTNNNMQFRKISHAVIGAGNRVFVAGGYDLHSNSVLDAVEIWDITSGIESHHTTHYNLQVFPNPATNQIEINGLEDLSGVRSTAIYSIDGALVVMPDNQSGAIDISNLRPGIYFLRIAHDNGTTNLRFVKR